MLRGVMWSDAQVGTSSDQAGTINTELSSLAAGGGGALFLPAGRITLASTIHVPSNVSLIGAGKGKTILAPTTDESGIFAFGTVDARLNNVEIRDLTVSCTGGVSSQKCIRLEYCDNAVVDNCELAGAWINGLDIFFSTNVRATNLDVHHMSMFGILTYQSSRITVEDCYVHDLTRAGRSLLGIQFKSSQRCRAVGNRVENVSGYGIYTWSDGTQPDELHIITNNAVTGSRNQAFAGIGIYVKDGYGHTVTDNVVEDTQDNGISVDGCVSTLVSGNVLNGKGSLSAAISVADISSFTRINNNRVTDYDHGIIIVGNDNRVSGNEVRNLLVSTENTSAGIRLSGTASRNVVSENIVDDNRGAGAMKRGIYADATTDHNSYFYNRATGTSLADYQVLGTNTTAVGNTTSASP